MTETIPLMRKVSAFSPTYPTIHMCHKGIPEVCYLELEAVLTSLQLKWDMLMTLDSVASACVLVCCMA